MSQNSEHAETGLPNIPNLSEAEKAEKLLVVNARNTVKYTGRKILEQVPLSPSEVKSLQEIAANKSSASDSSGNEPKFAKKQSQLADILGVSRKTIQRHAKNKDAPSARPNGSHSVAEWRAYLASKDIIDDDELDHGALKAKQILLQNQLLEHKLAVAKGEYVSAADVERDTADLIAVAKSVLLSGPASLAPQVVGVSIQEAETLLKEWLHSAMSKLQQNPLGRKESANV